MDMLKKLFPLSFKENAEVKDLVISIVVYVAAMVVAGLIFFLVGSLLGWIPLIGLLLGIVMKVIGVVIEIYCVGGIVLAILDYCKLLK